MLKSKSRRPWHVRAEKKIAKAQRRFQRARPADPVVLYTYPPHQTAAEEKVNWLTHGLAAIASLIAGLWLVFAAIRQGGLLTILGCAAYAATLTAVFTTSALSHFIRKPRLRQFFRTLDQASIYLYTAGSFTPYFIRYLIPEGWGWTIPVMWGVAILGAWDKLRGDRVNSISLWLYVGLGWFPIVAAKPLWNALPAGCVILVIAAGGCYMLGLAFLLHDERNRYFHAVWHLLVMAAGVLTYVGIALYVLEPAADPLSGRSAIVESLAPNADHAPAANPSRGQRDAPPADGLIIPANFEVENGAE